MEKPIRVSFDFDGTLEKSTVQKYAAELIERGFEVWIVTSRYDDETYEKTHHTKYHYGKLANQDLYEVAESLGIPKERIHFNNFTDKNVWFKKNNDFAFHIDDDWIEVRLINENTSVRCVSYFGNPNWKGKCEKAILKFSNSK